MKKKYILLAILLALCAIGWNNDQSTWDGGDVTWWKNGPDVGASTNGNSLFLYRLSTGMPLAILTTLRCLWMVPGCHTSPPRKEATSYVARVGEGRLDDQDTSRSDTGVRAITLPECP